MYDSQSQCVKQRGRIDRYPPRPETTIRRPPSKQETDACTAGSGSQSWFAGQECQRTKTKRQRSDTKDRAMNHPTGPSRANSSLGHRAGGNTEQDKSQKLNHPHEAYSRDRYPLTAVLDSVQYSGWLGHMARRSGLGRGLDALIPQTTAVSTDVIQEIAIEEITPNPRQPRQWFGEEDLQELAGSIRQHGVVQPIIVARTGSTPPYQIVAGERRWRAARLAGLTVIPAIIRELSPREAVEIALVENLQRADLSPLETALAYRTLIEEFGLTQSEVAERVGKSRSAVANTLRLLDAPEPIQRALAAGEISEGHARALLSLPDVTTQLEALRLIRDRGLTVRQTEDLVRRWSTRPQSHHRSTTNVPLEFERATQELQRRLRTKVELRRGARGGRLIIHYSTLEELQRLLDELLGQSDDELLG